MKKEFNGYVENLISLTDYVLGKSDMPFVPFQLDKQWKTIGIDFEPQNKRGFETSNCTAFTITSQIEKQILRVYGKKVNYSDRFLGIMAGTKLDTGNNPQAVYQAVRECGMIPEHMLPFVGEPYYYSFTGADKEACIREGKKWLEKYELQYEALWDTRPTNYMDIITEALKTSPIGVSVSAWRERNGEYVSDSGGNNHFTLCVAEREVEDSYEPRYKKLAKDHNVRRAYRIFIQNRTLKGMALYIKVLKDIISGLKKKPMDIATLCEQRLGTDVSPRDNAPDDLACAESATTLLKEIYPETPILTGTWTMYDYLRKPTSNWIQKDGPARNRVIISPTGLGKRGTHGHVGICLDDNRVASNKSATGTLETHLTVQYWNEYYGKLNYPVLYFEHV